MITLVLQTKVVSQIQSLFRKINGVRGTKGKEAGKDRSGLPGARCDGEATLCFSETTDRQQCTEGKNSSRLTVLFVVFVSLLIIGQTTAIRHMAKQVENSINVESYNPTAVCSVSPFFTSLLQRFSCGEGRAIPKPD